MELEITWTCHSCGRTRPDSRIDVATRDFGDGLSMSLRYCNDDEDCKKNVQQQLEMFARRFKGGS